MPTFSDSLQAAAANLYSFIMTNMLDPSDSTFFDLVNRNGSKPASPSKSLNANNYVMYALAVYGRQCDVPAASAAALAAWKAWDTSSWKGGSIGYDDTAKGRWCGDRGRCRDPEASLVRQAHMPVLMHADV